MELTDKPKVIAVVGPTSAGKTSLSISLAKEFSGEVISADSRQVYRGMDIGTGKVTREEMNNIPHHLLDIRDPMEIYTAADFENDAKKAISKIHKNNNLPIIAGGAYFYIQLLRGIIQSAPVPPNEEFREGLIKLTNDELFTYLKASDPRRASTIDSSNRVRLVRALEIIDAIGVVPEPTPPESDYDWLIIGTDIPKEQLHENIHIRLQQRMEAGMVEEARNLHKQGVTYERMDSLGLEYRYLAKHLQGEITEDEMFTLIEIKNKQYAKRQMTWLKRDSLIKWFSPQDKENIFKCVNEFLHHK